MTCGTNAYSGQWLDGGQEKTGPTRHAPRARGATGPVPGLPARHAAKACGAGVCGGVAGSGGEVARVGKPGTNRGRQVPVAKRWAALPAAQQPYLLIN